MAGMSGRLPRNLTHEEPVPAISIFLIIAVQMKAETKAP
jgi:hypothetical protein